jgi:Zn-dependent protease with chaperone function
MWERMQQSEGGSGVDFLSTHPANERRIKAIQGWLPEVGEIIYSRIGSDG